MGLKSKVGSKLSGAAKHADMLGGALGYIGTLTGAASSSGVGAVEGLINVHINALSRHNVKGAVQNTATPGSVAAKLGDAVFNPLLIAGATMGIAGIIGSYLPSLAPWQGTISSFAKKAGFGMAIGSVAAMITASLGEGSSPFTTGGSSGSSDTSSPVSSTGRVSNPVGRFAPPSPSVGGWARPQ